MMWSPMRLEFREWLLTEEKTLYHGTVVDNLSSIQKYGLQGGWHGPLGSFVSQFYSDEEGYGEPTEEDEVVFATDKQALGKAINAMTHHVGQKLGKDFHSVTDLDIRNHGLLVIIKHDDSLPDQYHSDRWSSSDNPPRGVEDGDYYAAALGGDLFLRGSALVRFLKQHDLYPVVGSDSNYVRGRLASMAIAAGHDKATALEKIKQQPTPAVAKELSRWRKSSKSV